MMWRKKIPGVSVAESLVAMFIILLSMTLAAGIYTSVSSSNTGMRSLLFHQECERIFLRNQHALAENETEVKAELVSGFLFKSSISDYKQSQVLKQFTVLVMDAEKNKKVFEYNRIFVNNTTETDVVQ